MLEIPKDVYSAGFTAWALHGPYTRDDMPPGLLVKLPCNPTWMARDLWATLTPDYDDVTRDTWAVHEHLADAWRVFTGTVPEIDPFDVGRDEPPHPMIEANTESVRLAAITDGYPAPRPIAPQILGYAYHLVNPLAEYDQGVPCGAVITTPNDQPLTLSAPWLGDLGKAIDTLMVPQLTMRKSGGGLCLREWKNGGTA